MAKFPDFICIGAMKCGTTALWRNLDQHPKITMCRNPENTKMSSTEIRFWNNGPPNRAWRRGLDWYKSLFHGDCCGEKCANYIESRRAMKRMSKHMPNVKLILCLRNPVERAYSEFQMQLKTRPNLSKWQRTFRWWAYVNRSRYLKQIKRNLLPFLPKERLYVVVQERMASRVVEEMDALFHFLELPTFPLNQLELPEDQRDDQMTGYRVWRSNYSPMDEQIRNKLYKWLWPHTLKLFDFLGFEVDEWRR